MNSTLFEYLRQFPKALFQLNGDRSRPLVLLEEKDIDEIYSLNLSDTIQDQPEVLGQLTGLKSLTLKNCGLENVDFVGNLTELRELDLTQNNISSIEGLSRLVNLNSLSLGKNPLNSIDVIQNFTKLTALYINATQSTSIDALNACLDLTHLDFKQNEVKDASPLSSLTSLKQIDASKNPLLAIEFCRQLELLEILSLASTKVEDFSPVFKLPVLKFLFAQNLDINPKHLKKLQAALADSFVYV